MESVSDLIQSAWGLLVAGIVLVWRISSGTMKRCLSSLLLRTAQVLAWVVLSHMLIKSLTTIGSILKLAKTPEQRAYAVAASYSILQQRAVDIVKHRATPKEFKDTLRTIDQLMTPVILEYVASVRVQMGRASPSR